MPDRAPELNLPTHSQLMLPMLQIIQSAGGRVRPGEIYDDLAAQFNLEPHEREHTTFAGGRYRNTCRAAGITPHPCPFPIELPRFAINMCTEEGDVVADLMAGSQTVAQAAEETNRRWITVERSLAYIEAGMHRLPNARRLLAS